MAKQDLPQEIQNLTTARPSAGLDGRIRAARDKVFSQRPEPASSLFGRAALFGLVGVTAGFGIGFAVATGFAPEDPPTVLPEVRVHWALSENTAASAFDFSRHPEPMFGGYFGGHDQFEGDR